MPLFYITTMRHSINLMDKYPENHGQMDTQPTKYCQEEFNSTCKIYYIKCNFTKRFTFLYTISFVSWQCPVGGIAPLSVPWWPPVAVSLPGPARWDPGPVLPSCLSQVSRWLRWLQPPATSWSTAKCLQTRDFQDLLTGWLALVIRRFAAHHWQGSKTWPEYACVLGRL